MRKKQMGFTLIELLIVVAIIGILAAIAIPNLLTALQRSKQKRTMADMRGVATSWEARATDLNRYNAAGALSILAICTKDISIAQLSGALIPTYIKVLPAVDGWGNLMRFRGDYTFGDPTSSSEYVIWSAGRNGTSAGGGFDSTSSSPGGTTIKFDCDIIFSNGVFVQYPEGAQSQ